MEFLLQYRLNRHRTIGLALLIAVLAIWLLGGGCASEQASRPNAEFRQLDALMQKIRHAQNDNPVDLKPRKDGLFEFYLDGEPSEKLGSDRAKIFSILGVPENPSGTPLPAVVLVHGGGGTAFAHWVRLWNEQGFIALAISTEGHTDQAYDPTSRPRQWMGHLYSGPARTGQYGDLDKPVSEQWMYHAVSAVIRANTYLRSRSDVDLSKIGVVGISWGGIITATTMGFDDRFAFAVPIYGAGALATIPNQYGALASKPAYLDNWEPTLRLSNFMAPVLWVNGRDDTHFSLGALSDTVLTASMSQSFAIVPGMKHGHANGWRRQEPYVFAKTIISSDQPVSYSMAKGAKPKDSLIITFKNLPKAMLKDGMLAELHTTKTSKAVFKKTWATLPLSAAKGDDGSLNVEVPTQRLEMSLGWYVTVSNGEGKAPLTFTTRYCRIADTGIEFCR